MNKKNKADSRGFIYSTDPNFNFEEEREHVETMSSDKQLLKIKLDSKQRAGKTVTLIEGFIGTDDDLNLLCKQIKNHCGTGGSAKDGIIIIQGDQKEKTYLFLIKQGYLKTKKQ
jgi:translation initiation factor 1